MGQVAREGITNLVCTMNTNPAELLRVAYRAAGRIVRNPVIAEEAAERAVHRLTLCILAGRAPTTPEAWIRTAAKRSACEILRNGWSRTLALDDSHEMPDEDRTRHAALREELCEAVRPALTKRQREVLEAALSRRTTKDAADACAMQPRDFRRFLGAITRRARDQFDLSTTPVPQSLRRWPRPPHAG